MLCLSDGSYFPYSSCLNNIYSINMSIEVLHWTDVALWEFSSDLPHSVRCISEKAPQYRTMMYGIPESWECSICLL